MLKPGNPWHFGDNQKVIALHLSPAIPGYPRRWEAVDLNDCCINLNFNLECGLLRNVPMYGPKPALRRLNARIRSGFVEQSSDMSNRRKQNATYVNALEILLISKILTKDRQYVTTMLNWINISILPILRLYMTIFR